MIEKKHISLLKKRKKQISKIYSAIIKMNMGLRNVLVVLVNFFNPSSILYVTSAGLCGIKGYKKTSFATTQLIIKNILLKIKEFKLKKIFFLITGYSRRYNRIKLLEMLKNFNIKIFAIKDQIKIAYNGCRPKKLCRHKKKMIIY
jgi:ribosomal protein S11